MKLAPGRRSVRLGEITFGKGRSGAPDYVVRDAYREGNGWWGRNPTTLHPAPPTLGCLWHPGEMLTSGIDHVATLTADSDRLQRFLVDMFDATVEFDGPEYPGGPRMTVINIGPHTELNVFQVDGNEEPSKQTPMFGRGRLDHVGYQAPSIEDFEEIRQRLMAGRATDGVVTDFGRKLSLFFRDPDAMECEVLVANPTPGTRAIGSAVPEYEPVPLD